MKDDVNDEVPNETPKFMIIYNGVVNWDGVLNSRHMLEGDHATHLWGWKERSIARKFGLKMLICRWYNW